MLQNVGQQNNPLNLDALPSRIGEYTRLLFDGYFAAEPSSARDAMNELAAELVPFNERLTSYISKHFCIDNDVKEVKRLLREASDEKGLGISSANLSQWISDNRGEVNISPRSIFKLILAMELELDEAIHFVYDCLYQNWFNYRDLEESVYFFFTGAQHLFGNEAYAAATSFIESARKAIEPLARPSQSGAPVDATGFTKVLGNGICQLIDSDYRSREDALRALEHFVEENAPLFTGVSRSSMRTYDTYFKTGGIGLKPLTQLYNESTGFTLPETSYLDMADASYDLRKKRLLWGTANRSSWIARNGKDWDVLHEREIKLERHAIERMQKTSVPRGNIIALLFFHFCFEHEAELKRGASPELFERFFSTANMTLVGECGMMPLHPRKHFDRLFLTSIAKSGNTYPLDYLNRILEEFYA